MKTIIVPSIPAFWKKGCFLWKTDDYYVLPMLPEHEARRSLKDVLGEYMKEETI